jgi:hypothetical protein
VDPGGIFKVEPFELFAMKPEPGLLSFEGKEPDPVVFLGFPITLFLLSNQGLLQSFILIHALMIVLVNSLASPMGVVPDALTRFIKVFGLLELFFRVQRVLLGQHGVQHVQFILRTAL